MRIACIGGGPAGLYTSILFKLANRDHHVVVYERNRADDTFGFGVVFSDATLGNLEAADPETLAQIRADFAHWDAIDTHVGGDVVRSVGHGFCGLERKRLLLILKNRAEQLGVELHFSHPISPTDVEALSRDYDLVVAADGVGSPIRDQFQDDFGPSVDNRPNRFVWLGTTFPFKAFTFYFKEAPEGLWRIHAYRYAKGGSTFIAECTAETLAATGLADDDEEATIAHLEKVFADELEGHPLIKNRSVWRHFPTVRNRCWRAGNIVLVGDAAHTAHFSIGSGTKLAMEDCIALTEELGATAASVSPDEIEAGLARYESVRRPRVERLQEAAEISLEWFENTERYAASTPLAFTYSLLTRSLRVTHDSLSVRDGELAQAALVELSGDPNVPAHQTAVEVYDRAASSRLATLEGASLTLAGGEVIGEGQPGQAGVCFVRIDANRFLAGELELAALADESASPIAVIEGQSGERGWRDIARVCDTVRAELGVPVVACMPGAAPSFLDTLLLAGRADLGVI